MRQWLKVVTVLAGTVTAGFTETPRMSVAVLELDADGITGPQARALTDRLRIELFKIGRFDVMERDKMDKLMEEQKLTAGGCTSTKCVIEIGRIMSVNGMVSGSIGRLGRKFLLNAQLVDVETGMILATATEECACPLEDLSASMDRVAQRLASVEKRDEFTVQYYDMNNADKGNFYIKSVPSGATVYLNGKMIRNVVTPLTIEYLPAGTYTVRAEKGDLAGTQEQVLQVHEFKKVNLALAPKKGTLLVGANIVRSGVYIDGQFAGKTPLRVPDLKVGAYTVKVKKPGFIDAERQVAVTDEKETRLDFELVRPGPLKLLSVPMEAAVYLDGEKKGVTPLVLTHLSAEPHMLELKKEGFVPYRETVIIESSDELKLEPTLVPEEGTIPPTAMTGRPPREGAGFDKAMKWITIGGAGAFVAVLVGAMVQ